MNNCLTFFDGLERLKMDSMSYSITTEFVCRDENYIYAVGRDAAIIFIIDAASLNVKKVMDIPSKHRIRQRLFCGICIAENNIILVPHNIEDIYIYNVLTEKWSTIDISNFVEPNLEGKFAGGKFNNGKLYLFGYRYKNILQVDLNTKNIKKMFAEDNHNFWGQSVVEFENHLYAVELANNQVIDINLDAHTLENSIQITESESALDNSNQGIVFDGEYFYLIKHHGNIVYKFKHDGKSERLYIDDFYDKKEPFFNGASIVNKKIFLFSPKGKNYICDLKETSLSKMKDEETFFACTYERNGMIICQRGKICILDKNMNVIKTINTVITKLEHDVFFKDVDLSGIVLAQNTMFGLDDFVRYVIN